MKLLKLSIRNIFVNKWRTFTLGFFIFLISFFMLVSNSFIFTIKSDMEDSIINAFTGQVIVRSDKTESNDLFSMDGRWNENEYIQSDSIDNIKEILDNEYENVEYTERVLYNAMFTLDEQSKSSMIIGIKPNISAYKESFKLESGRYLDPNNKNEVVLCDTQAEMLEAEVGSTIVAFSQTKNGEITQVPLKVVGIGNIKIVSAFNLPVAYTDLSSAQQLRGFSNGEVSDMVIYFSHKGEAEGKIKDLKNILKDKNLEASGIRFASWKDTGGFIMDFILLFILSFNAFTAIIMVIVSILIINFIIMIGLDRRKEIGMLKALGFSRMQNVYIFMGEIMTITLIFLVIGILVGSTLIGILSTTGITVNETLGYILGQQFYPELQIMQIAITAVVILSLVFVISFFPSYRISSLKPVDALREI